MATCCKSNSTFLIFFPFWLCDVGRVAVKHCFKLLSFFYIYPVVKSPTSLPPYRQSVAEHDGDGSV